MAQGNNGLPAGYQWWTVPRAMKPTAAGMTAKGVRTPDGKLLVGTGTSRNKAGTHAAQLAFAHFRGRESVAISPKRTT